LIINHPTKIQKTRQPQKALNIKANYITKHDPSHMSDMQPKIQITQLKKGYPGNPNKKRKTINVSYKLKPSNQENSSKEYNSIKRKKTIIKGVQDNTGIATAGRVFELYIGGISK
jgi:hypothetical protein